VSLDQFLDRRFHIRRYNCWHHARDVWLHLTGQDLGDLTPADISGSALAAAVGRQAPAFVRLPGPADPCLVLMLRARDVPHIGVYTGGRVHQIAATGVTFLPLAEARAGYHDVRFYSVADHHCN